MSTRQRELSSAMNVDSDLPSNASSTIKAKAIASVKYKHKHYLFEKKLGAGVQANVWLFRLDVEKYAGKITASSWIYEERKGEPEYWKKRMLSLCREMVFLSMINSPHVIHQVEIIKTRSNYYSVLEFANGGSMQKLLDLRGRFSEKFAVEAIRQIISGCQALYKVNVVHRDLKLDNILIDFPDRDQLEMQDLRELDLDSETFTIKIADLGYARELTKHGDKGRTKSFKGSPLMMAPEQLNTYWGRGSGYSHKIDVWAIGVIFYQMLTGMFIFNVGRQARRNDAMKALFDQMTDGTWSWPADITITLNTFDFLNKTMQHDPLQRPTWQEMMVHPMFTETASSRNNKIKIDIIVDEEPEEGLTFANGKIYVNTKDPTLYQRLHEKAVEKFIAEHEEGIEDHLTDMLMTQDQAVGKLFPRISCDLHGRNYEEEEEKKRQSRKKGSVVEDRNRDSRADVSVDGEQSMDIEFADSRQKHGSSAMDQIGITALSSDTRFSTSDNYLNVVDTLSKPEKYLEDIPCSRDTFTPEDQQKNPLSISQASLNRIDPGNNRGCCAPSDKGCVIF